jgi:predicted solute-binding protein
MIHYNNTLPWRHPSASNAALSLPSSAEAPSQVSWFAGTPTDINAAMANHELDMAIVSTASYLVHQQQWELLPPACIASHHQAESVFWVCQGTFTTLAEALVAHTELYLSGESSTSAQVFQGICQKLSPHPHRIQRYPSGQGEATFLTHGNALIIGDEALAFKATYGQQSNTQHREPFTLFDLVDCWHEYYPNTPLLFAVWVVQKTLTPSQQAHAQQLLNVLMQQAEHNIHTCPQWLGTYQLAPEARQYFQTALCYQLPLELYMPALDAVFDAVCDIL